MLRSFTRVFLLNARSVHTSKTFHASRICLHPKSSLRRNLTSMAEETPTKLPDAASTEAANPLKREADPASWSAEGKRAKLGNSEPTSTSTENVSELVNSSGLGGGNGQAETSTSPDTAADVVMREPQPDNDESRSPNTYSSATNNSGLQGHAEPESTEGTSTATVAGEVASTNQETAPGVSAGTSSASASGAATSKGKEEGQQKGKAKEGKKGRVGTREKAERRRGRRGAPRDSGDGSTAAGGEECDSASTEKAPRLPKRQCALLIGYCGSGCNGMQIQPGLRTIEGLLFSALVQAGAVSADNADDPVKVNLQRAARTDAGVHAAGNVVSMKIIVHPTGVPDLVKRVNEELPKEIRLYGFVRVQNSFNARMSCDSRKYTYFFPSYLLIPPKPGSNFARSFAKQSTANLASSSNAHSTTLEAEANSSQHPFWSSVSSPESTTREEDMVRKKAWRVDEGTLGKLRDAAKKYEGTHNFHNFTVGRDFKDRSCQRFMKKIEISDPAVYGETEWIAVMLHGQSFMLHQRKMMCVLVMLVRTSTPASIITELYKPRQVIIPKMPSLGLLLENPIFESYNKRVSDIITSKNIKEDHPDYRPAIDFELYRNEIEQFKVEHIYSRMRASEDKAEVFDRWLNQIDRYAGEDLLYYNRQGVVPDAAVMQRGVTRTNAFREKKRFDATEFTTEDSGKALGDEGDGDVVDEEKEVEGMGKRELEEAEG